MKKFHGIYPALITPITISGKIDYTGLRRLIRMNLKKNIQGFYVCGSTAEEFLIDYNQRKKILETVIDEVNGKCPIIVQVGSLNQKNACNLAIHAQQSGADVVSSVPPFYYQFSMDDILNYYRALADAVELPILIYNIPVFSGVKFTVNDLRPLLDDDRFIGLKHTSTDFYMLERLKAFWPHKVVFNGLDEVFFWAVLRSGWRNRKHLQFHGRKVYSNISSNN